MGRDGSVICHGNGREGDRREGAHNGTQENQESQSPPGNGAIRCCCSTVVREQGEWNEADQWCAAECSNPHGSVKPAPLHKSRDEEKLNENVKGTGCR